MFVPWEWLHVFTQCLWLRLENRVVCPPWHNNCVYYLCQKYYDYVWLLVICFFLSGDYTKTTWQITAKLGGRVGQERIHFLKNIFTNFRGNNQWIFMGWKIYDDLVWAIWCSSTEFKGTVGPWRRNVLRWEPFQLLYVCEHFIFGITCISGRGCSLVLVLALLWCGWTAQPWWKPPGHTRLGYLWNEAAGVFNESYIQRQGEERTEGLIKTNPDYKRSLARAGPGH